MADWASCSGLFDGQIVQTAELGISLTRARLRSALPCQVDVRGEGGGWPS